MTRLNLEFLINATIESVISNLDTVFENLQQEIKSYLNLDLIYSDIKITFSKEEISTDNLEEDFYNIGIIKFQKDNSQSIYLSEKYKKFIKIILLREAYKCFIPSDLQENEIVNIFINQKVVIDLQKSEFIEEWNELQRKSLISYDFMEAEFDRLENFLKQNSIENRPAPFQFFLQYLRKNIDLIESGEEKYFSLDKKGIYDKIFEEYTRKYTEYPEEILETIRIITSIFYKVKSYRSLLDYQHFFQEYKESGLIKTDLSLRKFTENMQWIKNTSNIAPTYQLNWFALEIELILCFLKFHPLIETSKIFNVITLLPFFTMPAYLKNNYGTEIIGYFLFPKIYSNDLHSFLEKLESDGYIIEKKIFVLKNTTNTFNLNFAIGKEAILNPNKKNYKKEYEIEFGFDYSYGTLKSDISLLDWFLIDRIRNISITGLGFERKSNALKVLKSALLNEIESQRKLINDIKENLNKIHQSPELTKNILEFINNNQSYGFFYIKEMLHDFTVLFDLIFNVLEENSSIHNFFQFQEFIQNNGLSKAIEDNLILNKIKKHTLGDLLSLYYKSKPKYKEKITEYRDYYNLFRSFNDLKLFNLKSIKAIIVNRSLIQKIYKSKEEKLKKIYESYKIYKITNQFIEQRLEDFLNNDPPFIHPNLLNTIMISPLLIRFYPILVLKDTPQTRENIEKIKWYFPRIVIVGLTEHKTNENYVYLRILMPNLKLKEKYLLYSIIHSIFKKNIIMSKSLLYSVFTENFTRRDFYDFEKENYFYTNELFDQFYTYVKSTFNKNLKPILEKVWNDSEDLWVKSKSISYLVTKIEKRISKEHTDLNFNNLSKLLEYHLDLKKNILNREKFKILKSEYFFRNYINKIKFIPSFQSFGYGEYFVYFYSVDLNQIDFKHFLHNSFQTIKFPVSIDNSNSFLIKFIWPYRNPNNKLLNWLVKSKKSIREYCLFFIKKVFQIFHFNYNLSSNEWDLDPNRFKIYIQNVLFNPDYNLKVPELKEFIIGDLNISEIYDPESSEFKTLTQLYNWSSIDIKSYLGTRNYTMVNHIIDLLEKNLIYPLISVKNLDLKNQIQIILPDVKKEYEKIVLKIFSFFNIGYIYEIEGEYYIHGFLEEIKFQNGFMIKLYLPDCQLDEFEILFDLIFDYLKIEHYIILNDLVDGKNFLKSIYGNLDFMKSYNPLKNLIWNDKDKKWKNNKLFTNKFEKIFPPLNKDD